MFPFSNTVADAAFFGRVRVLRYLLELGWYVDLSRDLYRNLGCYYAFVEAVRHGDKKVVKLLLEFGLNPRDNESAKALIHAARNGHKEIVELLINVVADVNSRNYVSNTA